MNYETFKESVMERMQSIVGDNGSVRLHKALKNNNQLLWGISILSNTRNLSPTIYLEPFYLLYQNGKDLDSLVADILNRIKEYTLEEGMFHPDQFSDFSAVKPYLRFRLVNRAWNQAILNEVPNRDFYDLSVLCCLVRDDLPMGTASILIRNEHLGLWNMEEAELFRAAEEIAPQKEPWECRSMDSILENYCRDVPRIASPLHVLTNQSHFYGAASIVYPGVLEGISDIFHDDMLLLPASIHEFLILPGKLTDMDPGEINRMIRAINDNDVHVTDRLSDHYYIYSRKTGKLSF